MKYQLLLAVMLLLSGCSAPPKEEVKKKGIENYIYEIIKNYNNYLKQTI